MSKKKYYKTITSNPDMGLNDTICKNKVGFCTKKMVFLNGQQVSSKMCRCKTYNEKTCKYQPCNCFIDKEKKPKKFNEKVEAARELHKKKGNPVSKKHLETIEKVVDGEVYTYQRPVCLRENGSKTPVYKKPIKDYFCEYSKQYMSSSVCTSRGCRRGQFGKLETNCCPYLKDMKPKKKKKTPIPPKQPISKPEKSRSVYSSEEVVIPPVELKDDEILLFGQVFKKQDILKGDDNKSE